jgi:hypothetical protein
MMISPQLGAVTLHCIAARLGAPLRAHDNTPHGQLELRECQLRLYFREEVTDE